MTTIRAAESAQRKPEQRRAGQVERFSLGSRLAHWNHAITFLLLFFTGAALVVRVIPGLLGRETLILFGQIHRIAAWPFTLLTIPILFIGARKAAIPWIRSSFRLDQDDRTFLARFALEFFGLKADLPHQGKFNGGEKVNSMLQILGWPIMAITGWMMVYKSQLPPALMRWVIPVHSISAFLLTAAAFGHIYLATLHPGSKAGLSGMLSGWVDAKWAKAHYRKWYDELSRDR